MFENIFKLFNKKEKDIKKPEENSAIDKMNENIRNEAKETMVEEEGSLLEEPSSVGRKLNDERRKEEQRYKYENAEQNKKETLSNLSEENERLRQKKQRLVSQEEAIGLEDGGLPKETRSDASIISEALGLEDKEESPKKPKEEGSSEFSKLRELLRRK